MMADKLQTGDYSITPQGPAGGGLTKREYFAAMAMQGLCASLHKEFEGYAEAAVEFADALIIALNRAP